jgi:riboflavin biosynthesis pyrimidine reductase
MEVLWDRSEGQPLPLPASLARACGEIRLPRGNGGLHLIANFATSLDGVASLSLRARSSGGDITGFYPNDRILMGVLRAASDVVIVGAGTFRAAPRHVWTAPHIYTRFASPFARLRARLGKSPAPLQVVVSASGRLDLRLPMFSSGEAPAMVVTTRSGARRLERGKVPAGVRIAPVTGRPVIRAAEVLRATRDAGVTGLALLEGGPHLMGDFLADSAVDELFLTLAPQVAGRTDLAERPGFVAGRSFAPNNPRWGVLVGVRRSGSYLFLRASFDGARRRIPE